ncbi:hypothetical protein MYCTH_2309975 [Thermothelomyces thermophilus ATCC 42464]|uniref:Uncharacterized protein n=1 Tax=Thermothelomyces thermophilus (strain ATCC 42464 / BCRC 31852 / DSM 1799) TaxID=573729 RepID=G2QKY3_THET4|nr:uncharacterized protein MYCTH_2309975 [Thermothelomyces thermophilus ATCC 42464]AEO60615.1 hypothetical protein MYCTH_2309975 [Thermothelomyces thermophilus ATCC 42464]
MTGDKETEPALVVGSEDQAASPLVATKADSPTAPPPEREPLPSYTDQAATLATFTPHRPFPQVLSAYSSSLKPIKLCGSSADDVLFAVETHTGYSGKTVLGTKPGLLLHNGTSKQDPILAAVGDTSQLAARAYVFSPESIILLPPAADIPSAPMATEYMHARTSGDDVLFFFEVEVGLGEKLHRRQFIWKKAKKGVDPDVKQGGFRLEWRPSVAGDDPGSLGVSSSSPVDDQWETVALLEWGHLLSRKMFTVQFLGSGLSGKLGERWRLMVVMTALRLLLLKVKGRTAKSHVAAGEKLYKN